MLFAATLAQVSLQPNHWQRVLLSILNKIEGGRYG